MNCHSGEQRAVKKALDVVGGDEDPVQELGCPARVAPVTDPELMCPSNHRPQAFWQCQWDAP